MGQKVNFGTALSLLKMGARVSRERWNGKGQYLELQQPEGKITQPFISIRTVQGDRIPWVASQADLLAEDWDIA